ncbi:MAG: serine hydrolase domain-containing protein [Thermodesulfobacteriota bacterium]|nr:serine hydrolase domain-containing protein [Thermodesulfobacteriota bacterium]
MNLCKNRHSFLALRRFSSTLVIACLILFLSVPSIWSDTPISGEALPGLEGFDKVMLRLIDKYDIPGASLAVAFNGKLILARGYGYAKKSLTGKIPVQPQSRFRFASLSKPLTAAAIMLLAEEGKFSLDDQIISLLQELGPQKIRDTRISQITVRNLLEHRGGFDSNISGDPMFLNQPPCPGNLKSFLAQKLDFTPGEKYVYSNIGYCILGRVIEKVTSKSYENFVKERVLEPVGAHSIELGASTKSKPNEVNYYELLPPFYQGKSTSPYGGFGLEAMDAHGGWIGSSIDYLRFLTAIDGQRMPTLLKPNTFAEMLAMPDDPTLKDKPTYYAKGFLVRKLPDGGRNFWHDGSLPGTSAIAVRTALGYGWVALFNGRTDDWKKLNLEIDRAIWEGVRSVKELPVNDLFNKY